MTNHYTSFETSKLLHEAGIVIGVPFYWVDKDGNFVSAYDPIVDEVYAAYTAGELLRELPLHYYLWHSTDYKPGVPTYWEVCYESGYEAKAIAKAITPEDALAYALLTIRGTGEHD